MISRFETKNFSVLLDNTKTHMKERFNPRNSGIFVAYLQGHSGPYYLRNHGELLVSARLGSDVLSVQTRVFLVHVQNIDHSTRFLQKGTSTSQGTTSIG